MLSLVFQGSCVQKCNLVAFLGRQSRPPAQNKRHLLQEQHRSGFKLVCWAPMGKLQACVPRKSTEESGDALLSCAVTVGTAVLRQGGGVGSGSGELSGKH